MPGSEENALPARVFNERRKQRNGFEVMIK